MTQELSFPLPVTIFSSTPPSDYEFVTVRPNDLSVLSLGIVAKEWMLNFSRRIKEEKGKVGGLVVLFFFFNFPSTFGYLWHSKKSIE